MKNKKLFAILTLVCFMFTLMPMAAFAAGEPGPTDPATSAFQAVDGDQVILTSDNTVGKTSATFQFALYDNANKATSTFATNDERMFVWAKDADGNLTSALNVIRVGNNDASQAASGIKNVQMISEIPTAATKYQVSFARPGVYTVYAGLANNANVTSLNDITVLGDASVRSTITVLGSTANPESYVLDLNNNGFHTSDYEYSADDTAFTIGTLAPDNISQEQTITLKASADGKVLAAKNVTIETNSSNIAVDKATATTNILGQVKFNISASREGNYEVYVTVDNQIFVLAVKVSNTMAAHIKTASQPSAPQAQFEGIPEVTFEVTDINGNAVKEAGKGNPQGMTGIFNNATGATVNNVEVKSGKYVFFTEKPAASTLTNENLTLTGGANGVYTLSVGSKIMSTEGKYAVKVILDNGAFATASWEIKKFETPVEIVIDAPSTVELGTDADVKLTYVDANGVEKTAKDAKVAATGYAVANLTATTNGEATVSVKSDEKYAGATISLTAVSERYDLVATKAVTVAAEAVAIAFDETNLAVNVNNKVAWNVVDAEGNKVTLSNVSDLKTVKYIVLDKPEGAKVSVYDLTSDDFEGKGKMALTSDKVGNVAVQVIAQVEVAQYEYAYAGEGKANYYTGRSTVQTKYYTGTQIFAVGTEGVGDVVVMSVGSSEIVKNGAKATIDSAPIVQNSRTFVPFRALAEAFGATVAYDEATQAVTAELNGVKVVLTIGSATYTVNGVEKTADVAPFINGSRTMVPVRFVAEAFGIKVIPTYDENGATADILFNL